MRSMNIQISTSATAPAVTENRSVVRSVFRGLAHRCPACGTGQLFSSYLKVADSCGHCAEPLHHHRADDAPPYFTIFIVGHVLVAGVLALEQAVAPSAWVHILIWFPLTIVMSLLALPRIKGALVGLQWALRMHGFGLADSQPNATPKPETPAGSAGGKTD